MSKKRLYLFNETSIAMNYGIGTYIDHLISCLQNEDYIVTLVFLDAREKQVKLINEAGCKKLIIPLINTLNDSELSRYYRSVVFILKDMLSSNEHSIFHLNYMTNRYLAYWITEILDTKPVLTVHYTDWSFSLLGNINLLKRLLKKKEEKYIHECIENDRILLSYCSKIICIARHSYNSLLEIHGEEFRKNVSLIPNALKDCYTKLTINKKNALREKYHIKSATKIIITAGRLEEVKGIGYILKVLKKLIKQYQDIHLFIAGNGNFQKYLIETKGIWTKVSFTGLINKHQLFELYSISDLGILSSIHEEFGLIAIEMMMFALPIVASDTSGLSEIFEDNITALKVPIVKKKGKYTLNTTVLYNKIELLINNPALAAIIGSNARKIFLEKYETKVYKKRMLEFYNSI